jgi:8-amino-7-oxononanoate synthase
MIERQSMEVEMSSPLGPRVVIGGRERDYFSGTGYLGLHNHPRVVAAAQEAIVQYGLSTGTSRGGYGEHPLYSAVNTALCEFFGAQASLYFASGYLGATILAQGLRKRCQRVFIDEGSHFSVWDGIRSAGMPLTAFHHADPTDLKTRLQRDLRRGETPLVFSDGLFPISGELAPVPEYLTVLEPFAGLIALDDAHAVGAVGPNGRGTLDYWGLLEHERCCWSATLSKALGGYGGILAGSQANMDFFESASKVTVAASPPPLPAAAASAAALRVAAQEPQRRERLWSNVTLARNGLRGLGWPVPDSQVPIICLGIRSGIDLGHLREELLKRDICVAHVTTYSSTPPGGALRIAIFADHSKEQIERLIFELGRLL